MFRFKQFTIHQDKSAMKVCTDACILGAWSAKKISEQTSGTKHILDIGCGTGLLSLMLAQKSVAFINAVEIQQDAAEQAMENISASPWKERIDVINSAIQNFATAIKYDFIISNPPFYENDLRSANKNKNAAMHDAALKFGELAFFIKNFLHKNGRAAILLPFARTEYFEKLAEQNEMFISEKLLIRQSPKHDYFRSVLLLSFEKRGSIATTELIIHDEQRVYTPEFMELLKDYYLHF